MRIAIIGFGFSGLLVAANLVRRAKPDTILYIIDEKADGRGTAYSTTNIDHLLNVPAGNMSAFADAPDDLVTWLKSEDAAAAKAQLGLARAYGTEDFVPRALYGEYLASIWRTTQEIAAQRKLAIKIVPTTAVALQHASKIAVLTVRGDAIAVDEVILAVGHEGKRVLPQVKSASIIQDPWIVGVLDGALHWTSPVMLLGTGLTSVDMLLSLRRVGYAGEIAIVSFRGLVPQSHTPRTSIFSFNEGEVAAAKTLRAMVRMVRKHIASHGEWRVVIDALRPYTQSMWQRLKPSEQQRFLRFFMPQWNVHRHRMAPEIAAVVDTEIAAAKTRIITSNNIDVRVQEDALHVTLVDTEINPSHIINCTGLELNLMKTGSTLLKQLLADGAVEAHATGLGLVADKHQRAWGTLHPHLSIIGSLLTGQLLESTAVPELRSQALMIAESIADRYGDSAGTV